MSRVLLPTSSPFVGQDLHESFVDEVGECTRDGVLREFSSVAELESVLEESFVVTLGGVPMLPQDEKRASEAYGVNAGDGITLQNQGDKTRGIDHASIVEGLRPIPVLERMGATVIQATGDLVLPSLQNAEATTTSEGVSVTNVDGDFGGPKLSPKRFAM